MTNVPECFDPDYAALAADLRLYAASMEPEPAKLLELAAVALDRAEAEHRELGLAVAVVAALSTPTAPPAYPVSDDA